MIGFIELFLLALAALIQSDTERAESIAGRVRDAHLESGQVRGLEVVRRAAAPVHDVLVLTLAAQLSIPVSDAEVVVHHALAVRAVLQNRVEERLRRQTERESGRRRMINRKGR